MSTDRKQSLTGLKAGTNYTYYAFTTADDCENLSLPNLVGSASFTTLGASSTSGTSNNSGTSDNSGAPSNSGAPNNSGTSDNDGTPEPAIRVSRSALTLAEAGGRSTYTIVLRSEPTGDVTVRPSSSDDTVATVTPNRLTFTPDNWDTLQTVTVTGVDDDRVNDPDRRAMVSHDISGGGYDNVAVDPVSITLTDDDSLGVSVTPAALTLAEAGGRGAYTIVLESEPTGDVTVTVSSSDSTAATVDLNRLTFTPDNWSTPQTVTVTGVDDDRVNDSPRTATVSHGISGGGYGDVPVGTVSITLTDDDTPREQVKDVILPEVMEKVGSANVRAITARLSSIKSERNLEECPVESNRRPDGTLKDPDGLPRSRCPEEPVVSFNPTGSGNSTDGSVTLLERLSAGAAQILQAHSDDLQRGDLKLEQALARSPFLHAVARPQPVSGQWWPRSGWFCCFHGLLVGQCGLHPLRQPCGGSGL